MSIQLAGEANGLINPGSDTKTTEILERHLDACCSFRAAAGLIESVFPSGTTHGLLSAI